MPIAADQKKDRKRKSEENASQIVRRRGKKREKCRRFFASSFEGKGWDTWSRGDPLLRRRGKRGGSFSHCEKGGGGREDAWKERAVSSSF